MTASDWATVASLATALGTLVLAAATFSAVRSGNRTARAAERSLLAGLRPVLMASHREDPTLKVNFSDSKWVGVPGGCAVGEVGGGDGSMGPKDGVVYLALSLRNVGQGISVLRAWYFHHERPPDDSHPPVAEFRPHQRDLYLPVGQPGFWQGAFRDPAAPQYEPARRVVEQCEDWYLDLLYGDQEGGQRVITRFRMQMFSRGDRPPRAAGDERGPWMATVARHWNLDRPDPRLRRKPPDSGNFPIIPRGSNEFLITFCRIDRASYSRGRIHGWMEAGSIWGETPMIRPARGAGLNPGRSSQRRTESAMYGRAPRTGLVGGGDTYGYGRPGDGTHAYGRPGAGDTLVLGHAGTPQDGRPSRSSGSGTAGRLAVGACGAAIVAFAGFWLVPPILQHLGIGPPTQSPGQCATCLGPIPSSSPLPQAPSAAPSTAPTPAVAPVRRTRAATAVTIPAPPAPSTSPAVPISPGAPPGVTYRVTAQASGGFAGQITVVNHGTAPISDWQLVVALPLDSVSAVQNADFSYDSDVLFASPAPGDPPIRPGGALVVTIDASGPTTTPADCSFDHVACQ